MAVVVRRRVRIANPARKKFSPAQIAAGFGGKRRQAAAKHRRRKPAVRRNVAKRSKLAGVRRRPARRKNIGEIITLGAVNPARKGVKVATKKRAKARKSTAGRRRKQTNPAKRRVVVMVAKRRNGTRRHHKRNPGTRNISAMLTKAGLVVGGLVGARAVTQLAFSLAKNPGANTGVVGYLSNIAAAWGLGLVTAKFKSAEAGQMVTIGGIAGVVARAVAEYSPIGGFVRAQLSGLGDYGLGIYMPGQFGPPWVPTDSQTLAGGSTMMNPFPAPLALPAPAGRSGGGVGRLGDIGSGVGGRYASAGRYN